MIIFVKNKTMASKKEQVIEEIFKICRHNKITFFIMI